MLFLFSIFRAVLWICANGFTILRAFLSLIRKLRCNNRHIERRETDNFILCTNSNPRLNFIFAYYTLGNLFSVHNYGGLLLSSNISLTSHCSVSICYAQKRQNQGQQIYIFGEICFDLVGNIKHFCIQSTYSIFLRINSIFIMCCDQLCTRENFFIR